MEDAKNIMIFLSFIFLPHFYITHFCQVTAERCTWYFIGCFRGRSSNPPYPWTTVSMFDITVFSGYQGVVTDPLAESCETIIDFRFVLSINIVGSSITRWARIQDVWRKKVLIQSDWMLIVINRINGKVFFMQTFIPKHKQILINYF
jgi:hypothetical protein